jgi:hypothetical protein
MESHPHRTQCHSRKPYRTHLSKVGGVEKEEKNKIKYNIHGNLR